MTDQQFNIINGKLDAIIASLKSGSRPAAAPIKVDLDGQYGDPTVKFPTNRWTGENFDGRPFSQCPAEFLLLQAEWLEQKGASPKAGKEQWAKRDMEHAACARGWAERNAKNPPHRQEPAAPDYGTDGDIPFASCDASADPLVVGHRSILDRVFQ